MGPLRFVSATIRLATAMAIAALLVVGGLVDTPAAHAAIASSQITTPTNPSFFVADEDARSQTFAISGTTAGGNPAGNLVDVRCYFGATSVMVKGNVALGSDGSFSVPAADLNKLHDLTCQLRAVPAGTKPSDLTPFSGPVVGVGSRETAKIGGGANNGKAYDFSFDAQQQTAAFDYASVGSCGLHNGFLYDSTYANTTVTFSCNAGLGRADSPVSPTRSELQIDGANAYAPTQAFFINPGGTGLAALTQTYTVDKATGNVVIDETDPLVECSAATYPPTTSSCAAYVSAGVTDNRTITQDHDGHISWITDVFKSTDDKAHSIDLLWDDNQQFFGASGNSSQLEYEFPGESSFSTHATGSTVSLPSSAGSIFVRMHGAADGATGTGQGAIVYDRPATAAKFTSVTALDSEFTLHQTGTVPAGGSTRFRFAYVQDYQAALVAARAKTGRTLFLNTITVAKSGRGKVTSSPGGISCGKACSHGYAYAKSVTLRAKAARGSKFVGWSGACTGTHRCKVTTTDNVTVEAKFALRPCIVPNVVGKRLTAAKAAIRKAFCSVGKVRMVASANAQGEVISQRPRHGKRLKQHARIDLVVSKG
jgi:List-Bact-rpt repeat protein/PASTA domain-containing protein